MSDKLEEIKAGKPKSWWTGGYENKYYISVPEENYDWLITEVERLRRLHAESVEGAVDIRNTIKILTQRCEEAQWLLAHKSCDSEWFERRDKWLEGKP